MKNADASAFPVPAGAIEDKDGRRRYFPLFGLTKREWFAGLAMQGMLADNNIKDSPEE